MALLEISNDYINKENNSNNINNKTFNDYSSENNENLKLLADNADNVNIKSQDNFDMIDFELKYVDDMMTALDEATDDDDDDEEDDDANNEMIEYMMYQNEIENYRQTLELELTPNQQVKTTDITDKITVSNTTSSIQSNSNDTINIFDIEIPLNDNDYECAIVKSHNDNRILNDKRLLCNLNNLQLSNNVNSCCYFTTIQNDIKPYMRKIVVSWMLDVCEEEKCDKLVFPSAVFILDKFLGIQRITRNIFQLVACVCLFVASKLFNVIPITADKLVLYSDNSISIEELIDMEMIVLNELKWDILYVTPIEYADYLINKIHLTKIYNDNIDVKKLMVHCKTLICLCLIEIQSTRKLATIVSKACLLCAFQGLYPNLDATQLNILIIDDETVESNLDILNYQHYVNELYANSVNKMD